MMKPLVKRCLMLGSILYSCYLFAQKDYQIDVILFTHLKSTLPILKPNTPFIPPNPKTTTFLSKENHGAYSLLPPSRSGLRNEYYLLSHQPSYQILGQYSWTQQANQHDIVALPPLENHGWQLQGTFHVQQNNYYLLEAKLQCSPPNQPEATFQVKQKQRLKGNTVYYLDHSNLGMLVKIHPLVT